MVDNTKRGIARITAVTELLKHRQIGKIPDEEVLMKKTMKFISASANSEFKIDMVAATSKAIKLLQQEPSLTDRQVISQVMKEFEDHN